MTIQRKNYGFTLVEVMIVVSIIALLATITIPNLLRSKIEANQTSAQSSLKTIAVALENYSTFNNLYPTNPNLLLTATPPYLNVDFFTGTHNGYNYTHVIANFSYVITAAPASSNQGNYSYSISTGAVLVRNP